MIDDLIFKGRNLDEALEKSSNFFGVIVEKIRYEIIDEGPEEVCIKLVENPIKRKRATAYKETERTVIPKQDDQPQIQGHTFRPQQGNTRPQQSNTRPQQSSTRPQQGSTRPQQSSQRPPGRDNVNRSSGRDDSSRAGGSYGRRDSQQHSSRGRQSGPRQNNQEFQRRDNSNFRNPVDNWKPEEVDISSLNENEQTAFSFVEGILKKMSLNVGLNFSQDQERLVFDITGPDRSMLLMKKGEPLISIQYLVNKIYLRNNEEEQPIFIDSQGYRIDRDEELNDIAMMSAEKVIKTKMEYVLSPMNPYERRIVHLAIKEVEGVHTESQGDGYIKRVAIFPGNR